MHIEACQPADKDDWLRLRDALWPEPPGYHEYETAGYFEGQNRAVDQVFLAKTTGGEVVGFIELRIRNYAEGSDQARVPYIEGWYVAEAHRGQGVGGLLVRAAEEWARGLGFSELGSDSELDNDASIAAHRALGFAEVTRTVNFLKRL